MIRQALIFGAVTGTLFWVLGFPSTSWGHTMFDWAWCVGAMFTGCVLVDILKNGKKVGW